MMGKITDPPEIIILCPILDPEQLNIAYNRTHAFVLPTYGEGWGLPFCEAAAVGKPIIATNWGGHLEYLNHDNSYLIDIDGLFHTDSFEFYWYRPEFGLKWAKPNVKHLAELMMLVYHDYDNALIKAEKCRQDIQKYTWKYAAEKIIEVLKELDKK